MTSLQLSDSARCKSIDYSIFAPKLFNLCERYGLNTNSMALMIAFSGAENSGYACTHLVKHFGRFPIDIGLGDNIVNVKELENITGQFNETVLIHTTQFNGTFSAPNDHMTNSKASDDLLSLIDNVKGLRRAITNEPQLKNKKLLYINGWHKHTEEPVAHIPEISFIPWSLFIHNTNGSMIVHNQNSLIKRLDATECENSRSLNLPSSFK